MLSTDAAGSIQSIRRKLNSCRSVVICFVPSEGADAGPLHGALADELNTRRGTSQPPVDIMPADGSVGISLRHGALRSSRSIASARLWAFDPKHAAQGQRRTGETVETYLAGERRARSAARASWMFPPSSINQ